MYTDASTSIGETDVGAGKTPFVIGLTAERVQKLSYCTTCHEHMYMTAERVTGRSGAEMEDPRESIAGTMEKLHQVWYSRLSVTMPNY